MSRRGVLRWSAAAAGLSLPLSEITAQAATSSTPPTFVRGINAWPWLVMPMADPPPGKPYPVWPPFDASRPIPSKADLAALAAAGFDFIRLAVDPAPFLNTQDVPASDQFERLFDLLLGAIRRRAPPASG